MKNSAFPFSNTYSKLPENFYAKVQPAQVPSPELLLYNQELAKELGIDSDSMNEAEMAQVFSGNTIPEGAEPLAMAYSGHQFGHFSPQLGDGRALLLGELDGYDVQLKGSGVTPFSRRGDGKSSLGPVVREYIVSEAMYRLGIPTTRALAAVSTGEDVYRETSYPGGVFTRVAASHIRVGTFEFFASKQDKESVSTLLDYAIQRHYPEIKNDSDKPIAFLHKVMQAQANLVADWMSVGFIHGVMNTDNCSVAGITIDFGPCAFMDKFKADKVYSSIDHQGRYAYNNQPMIAHWNMARLAETLIPLFDGDEKEVVKMFEEELAAFQDYFEKSWFKKMCKKLGISKPQVGDEDLIQIWLGYLQEEKLDFTLSFRRLSDLEANSNFFPKSEMFNAFKKKWERRIKEEDEIDMNSINPLYIPRNHQVERAIQAAYNGDYSLFKEMNEILQNPYTEQKGAEIYTAPPEAHEEVKETFCGT